MVARAPTLLLPASLLRAVLIATLMMLLLLTPVLVFKLVPGLVEVLVALARPSISSTHATLVVIVTTRGTVPTVVVVAIAALAATGSPTPAVAPLGRGILSLWLLLLHLLVAHAAPSSALLHAPATTVAPMVRPAKITAATALLLLIELLLAGSRGTWLIVPVIARS